MKEGLEHTSVAEVTAAMLACNVGSGDMEVLATPAMLALMENAAMTAVAPSLPEDSTTVGGHISSSHLMPTPCGETVTATAVLTVVNGNRLTFHVSAHDSRGNLLGEGEHLRFVVNRDRFLAKIKTRP